MLIAFNLIGIGLTYYIFLTAASRKFKCTVLDTLEGRQGARSVV